jgi:hypothetical protein
MTQIVKPNAIKANGPCGSPPRLLKARAGAPWCISHGAFGGIIANDIIPHTHIIHQRVYPRASLMYGEAEESNDRLMLLT